MKNTAYFFTASTGIIVALIYGQSLIVPFIFALLLWFLVRKIRQQLDKISFIKKHFPSWLKNLIPSLLIFTVLSFITKILVVNINNLVINYSNYEANVELVIQQINDLLRIDLVHNFKTEIANFNFTKLLSNLLKSLTDILSNTFMIIIYVLFIFLEETNFTAKLKNAYTDKSQYTNLNTILANIEDSISNYIGIKTLTSLSTGFLSYITLLFIGIDAPLFWAFLIFLLNFIPTIGSIIATVFPTVFCLLQFGDFMPSLIVFISVGSIQVIIGNILEPKIMGNSLNISPLVAITSLLLWGSIWGVTGMLLSIPITVIMVIIFANFDKTKPIAILFSEKGTITSSN